MECPHPKVCLVSPPLHGAAEYRVASATGLEGKVEKEYGGLGSSRHPASKRDPASIS